MSKFKNYPILLLAMLLWSIDSIFAQVREQKNDNYHSFSYTPPGDTLVRVLKFYAAYNQQTQNNDFDYTVVEYRIEPSVNPSVTKLNLQDELPHLDTLLKSFTTAIPAMSLKMLDITEPYFWKDVLDNQIKAFAHHKEWMEKGIQDKVIANSPLMSRIMKEQHVYGMLEPLLLRYGYTIHFMNVHKIALWGTKTLKREAGYQYKGQTYIPMPGEFAIELQREIQIPEIMQDTLVPVEMVAAQSKNVFEKYGLEFTGNCYACDLANLVIKEDSIYITNVCGTKDREALKIISIKNVGNNCIIEAGKLKLTFTRVDKAPVFSLKINGQLANKNLRISKYFTFSKMLPKFKIHDCGDFGG